MLKTNEIHKIRKQSAEEKWPFPKTFEALAACGVESYSVNLSTWDVVFKGHTKELHLNELRDFGALTIGPSFLQKQIVDAISRHQRGETTYLQVMKEIATAGVDSYIVDMIARKVTYFGKDPSNIYEERVPVFKS